MGTPWEKKLYVDQNYNFTGWRAEYRPGEYNGKQFMVGGAENDAVSSVRVFENGCPSEKYDTSVCSAVVY